VKSAFPAAATLLSIACSGYVSLPNYGVIPDFVLTDQSRREFRSKERLAGNVWVANFIFTNCAGPCPRMSSQMRHVRDAAKADDVRFVSFTIDPARDTPEVLAAYSKRFGADPERWYFLTGPQSELHKLCRNAFMLGNVDGNLEHSTRFVLLDRHSRIRGFYDSADSESMQRLATDLQTVIRSSA
jgi:cytochrome oxidase Cu insertion factor (SCO1/SenC/PrrC family)